MLKNDKHLNKMADQYKTADLISLSPTLQSFQFVMFMFIIIVLLCGGDYAWGGNW